MMKKHNIWGTVISVILTLICTVPFVYVAGKSFLKIEGGFTLEGFYRGEKWFIHRTPAMTNSLHVEYDFGPIDKRDYLDISTENDSFYCAPSKENVITKLAFATEELYLRSVRKK